MTPIQTFGQTAAPSNMMFPTAAYLQASQNAAEMQARGMGELGRGLAGGISAAVAQYSQHKDEQARFDATKKMYSAFKNYLPEESRSSIEQMFSDTSMSVKEKNQIAPLLMNMIAQGQQQQGRESVARIMANSREAIADMKNQPPAQRPAFTVGSPGSVFDTPTAPPASGADLSGLPMNSSPGNPADLVRTVSSETKTRRDPVTGVPQFFEPNVKRWIDERAENNYDFIFRPDFRMVP
jgi:hypothetical protein